VPTISKFTNVSYSIWLNSDPFDSFVYVPFGTTCSFQLSQLTAGPISSVSVKFGDSSPTQNYTLTSSSVNITKTFAVVNSALGCYVIAVTPVAVSLNVSIIINSLCVKMFNVTTYSGNQKIKVLERKFLIL
jgi:hypothetical protein